MNVQLSIVRADIREYRKAPMEGIEPSGRGFGIRSATIAHRRWPVSPDTQPTGAGLRGRTGYGGTRGRLVVTPTHTARPEVIPGTPRPEVIPGTPRPEVIPGTPRVRRTVRGRSDSESSPSSRYTL